MPFGLCGLLGRFGISVVRVKPWAVPSRRSTRRASWQQSRLGRIARFGPYAACMCLCWPFVSLDCGTQESAGVMDCWAVAFGPRPLFAPRANSICKPQKHGPRGTLRIHVGSTVSRVCDSNCMGLAHTLPILSPVPGAQQPSVGRGTGNLFALSGALSRHP